MRKRCSGIGAEVLALTLVATMTLPSARVLGAVRGSTAPPRAPAVEMTTPLPGHVLPGLERATLLDTRAGADAESVTLTVVLTRRDQRGFERYLRAISDPTSPSYHRFLSTSELTASFGPTKKAYDAVVGFLRSRGFTLIQGSKNRLTLTLRGTRAQAERGFGVNLRDYEIEGRRFVANDRAPAVPTAIAPLIQSIAGLSTMASPARPALLDGGMSTEVTPSADIKVTLGICGLVTGLVGNYGIAENLVVGLIKAYLGLAVKLFALTPLAVFVCGGMWVAVGWAGIYCEVAGLSDPSIWTYHPECAEIASYGFGPSALTLGDSRAARGVSPQKIGLLEFDTYNRSDVADWLSALGGEAALAKLSDVPVNGGVSTPGRNEAEVLVDIDTVMLLGSLPGINYTVYHAPPGTSFGTMFNAMIDDGVTVISNSWSQCEDQTTVAESQAIDTILQQAAAAGISVFNASGDTGSTCLDGAPNTAGVPANSPHATAVGGSSPTPGPGVTYGTEEWWDGSAATPPTGQGGFGISTHFARPSYQDAFTTSSMRSVPDVVTDADPIQGIQICQASAGGCPSGRLFGGTSLAAPQWAAYAADLNVMLGRNLGEANLALYPLAATDGFHDAASLGSDFAHVGLGSPNLLQLRQVLSGEASGAVSGAKSVVVATGINPDSTAPADGATAGVVQVMLVDAKRTPIKARTVTLAPNGGASAIITPASGVSDDDGSVLFNVTDLVPEDVTFTATDTTDGIVLTKQATLSFVVPPATSAGVVAFPTTVTADGMASTTITITLQDVLGRPTPGKEIVLSQGAGHSFITGPSPSLTDGAGQIQFTATNLVNETVTYTAVDVTDGDLPVQGSAPVVFNGGAGTACGSGAAVPTAQNGYVLTPWAGGFPASAFVYAGVNFNACFGASFPAFAGDGAYLTNFFNGEVFKLPVGGGTASSANRLATINPTIGAPVIGKDGKVYAAIAATMNDINQGAVVELDPTTGAIARTVAPNLRCPFFLAVDPLSGDLFYDDGCSGFGWDPKIHRIRNPAGLTPTVEDYVTLSTPSSSANGSMAFAPNGSLYVVADYFNATPPVVRISGTDGPTPPTMTTLPGLASYFWLNIAETQTDGEARSLVLLFNDGLKVVDITTSPPTQTVVATNLGGGTIGPDGCLYAGTGTAIYKLSDPSGGCTFAPAAARPLLSLTPFDVTPNPAQGSTQTFTAKLHNVDMPADTRVYFDVNGANPRLQIARTNADGEATFSYTAVNAGRDTIVATTNAGGSPLTSNKAHVQWDPGKHVTFLTLNPSPVAAAAGARVDAVASLIDMSADPIAPVAGVNVAFQLDTAQCSASTNAQGLATCQLVASRLGSQSLTATFEGTPELVGSSDTIGFAVSCPGGLDGVNCYLDQITASLNAAAGTDVKAKVKKQLLGKVKKLKKAVTKAGAPGKKGAKATKKLGKKLDGFVKQLQRLSSKKMAATLRDVLVALATSARSAVPAASP